MIDPSTLAIIASPFISLVIYGADKIKSRIAADQAKAIEESQINQTLISLKSTVDSHDNQLHQIGQDISEIKGTLQVLKDAK